MSLPAIRLSLREIYLRLLLKRRDCGMGNADRLQSARGSDYSKWNPWALPRLIGCEKDLKMLYDLGCDLHKVEMSWLSCDGSY